MIVFVSRSRLFGKKATRVRVGFLLGNKRTQKPVNHLATTFVTYQTRPGLIPQSFSQTANGAHVWRRAGLNRQFRHCASRCYTYNLIRNSSLVDTPPLSPCLALMILPRMEDCARWKIDVSASAFYSVGVCLLL